MDKMKMETPDLTQENVEKLLALFPECATEVKQHGKVTRGVNFDVLQQLITPYKMEGDEAYEFTWVGKKAAFVEANRPIRKTLRPVPEKSKDWQKTENLYIEGDNLEALKLLRKAYLGQVKMIYIDPPYNTGNDFIYNDSFKMSKEELAEGMGLFDEEGNRTRDKKFAENSATNPRFHSDWCSMIYARLLLSKNLLTDDGIILISIDEREYANLRKISDEVFGEQNYFGDLVWEATTQPINAGVAKFSLQKKTESIIVYGKCKDNIQGFKLEEAENTLSYPHKGKFGACRFEIIEKSDVGDYNRPSMRFKVLGQLPREGKRWQIGEETARKLEREGKLEIVDGIVKKAVYPDDEKEKKQYKPFWSLLRAEEVGTAQNGKNELNTLMDRSIGFDTVKPIALLKKLISLISNDESTILDFFSGSATTAHAVMQMNAEDGGHRRFIMVQLPEKTDEKSEAKKAGFDTICDIGEERIRRAGEKIKAESPLTTKELDTGFRVFRVDDSNMKDVYYSADEVSQDALDGMISNIKEDRSALDLLFGCLVDWGIPLSKKCTSETVDGHTIYDYGEGDLLASFDTDISESVIEAMARKKPLRAVFRDGCFSGSQDKINVFEIFKMLSPDTTIRVL